MVYIVYFYCRWQYLCVILFKCFFKIHNIFLNENILQRIERMSYSIHHLLATIYLLTIFSLSLATLSSKPVSSTTSTTRLSGCSGWCCSSSCSQVTQIYFHNIYATSSVMMPTLEMTLMAAPISGCLAR